MKILALNLPIFCTYLFYFVLKHCISGFGVDFDLLFMLCSSLTLFRIGEQKAPRPINSFSPVTSTKLSDF